MLNEPLAKHYGIDGVYGRAFRPVALAPDKHRGGLLSRASILLMNSTGGDSHPIRRAVWIRDRLLNDPPAPPPPNVPSLEETSSNFNQLSIRAVGTASHERSLQALPSQSGRLGVGIGKL